MDGVKIELSDEKPLKVLCLTWNVGNAQPLARERAHLVGDKNTRADLDLIVIGAQEATYGTGEAEADGTLEELRRKTVPGPAAAAAATSTEAASVVETGANDNGVGVPTMRHKGENKGQLRQLSLEEEEALKASEDHFYRFFESFLAPEFYRVESISMGEIRLIVFARAEHRANITAIDTSWEATGFGHVLTNKVRLFSRL